MTAFDRDGVAADYAAIPAELLAPKPRALSHPEAAAVPLAALSAWQGLFEHGRLAAGERVLIHGATGGVGQFATPLAARHGAHVTATTSARGVERARELGADVVIGHTAGPWDAGIEPVDLVFDTAGGERLARSPSVVREGGRLVSVAEEPPQASGVTSVYFVVEPNRPQLVQIAALLDGGLLPPAIDSVFALEEAVERLRAQHGRRQAREGRARGGTLRRLRDPPRSCSRTYEHDGGKEAATRALLVSSRRGATCVRER